MTSKLRGGGDNYERGEVPDPDTFVQEVRKERIEQVVAQRTRNLVVVLDRLEDSFNIAAVMRTCEGLGIQEVHVINNPDYPFEPHQRVSQGCDKWLDVTRYKTFAECKSALKARGFSLWVSAIGEGAVSLYSLKFDSKMALVFGNERHGVSEEVLAGADGMFWIPMRGFSQSFNISVAAAMSLSRAVSWRLERNGDGGDLLPAESDALREKFVYLSVKQRKRIYKDRRP